MNVQLIDTSRDVVDAPDEARLPQASRCRLCGNHLEHVFVDLGSSPLCQTVIAPEQLDEMEPHFPLNVLVCGNCFLVQLREYVSPENIFREYAYFSSYSTSWVAHAKAYCEMIKRRLGLGPDSLVVEIASNDGYLLQHFLPLGVPVLGVEPAANVAKVAIDKGVPTWVDFFGFDLAGTLAAEGKQADLIVGNNVLAQVPELNDFVSGLARLLKPEGVITLEFPHLERLMAENQFDTIYHEHFQYYTVASAQRALASGGLMLVDVELLPTHGGSIRLWAKPEGEPSERVADVLEKEKAAGLHEISGYVDFANRVAKVRRDLLRFLIDAADQGKSVVGYGAPGKGNTLLNHCGIRPDMLAYTVDRNPYKHGRYTPGTRIPILPPEQIAVDKPDYVLILPWNLRKELTAQLSYVGEWGGRLVFPIPHLEIVEVKS